MEKSVDTRNKCHAAIERSRKYTWTSKYNSLECFKCKLFEFQKK